MSYYFGILQGRLSDGTHLGLLLQDGIGSQYSGVDRASEDSITIEGKVYKLGRSRLEYNPYDLMAPRRVQTLLKGLGDRYCDLTYTPQHHQHEGLNLLLVSFEQEMTYGVYNGKCVVEGMTLEITNMWGLMETVSTRL